MYAGMTRRVATGLRGYAYGGRCMRGSCPAEGVVQKSGAKDESSRSGTLTFNRTHASERGAAARKSRFGSRTTSIARDEKFVSRGRRAKRGEKESKRHHGSAQQPNSNNHVPSNSPQGIPHSGY